jgi:ParB family chromosome partitioning protein
MANSSKLGRGLDILLGQTSSSEKSDNNLKILGINELQRGQFQPLVVNFTNNDRDCC